jgi:hypothetical protein
MRHLQLSQSKKESFSDGLNLGKTISTLTQCKNNFRDNSVYKCHETMVDVVKRHNFANSFIVTKIKPLDSCQKMISAHTGTESMGINKVWEHR